MAEFSIGERRGRLRSGGDESEGPCSGLTLESESIQSRHKNEDARLPQVKNYCAFLSVAGVAVAAGVAVVVVAAGVAAAAAAAGVEVEVVVVGAAVAAAAAEDVVASSAVASSVSEGHLG